MDDTNLATAPSALVTAPRILSAAAQSFALTGLVLALVLAALWAAGLAPWESVTLAAAAFAGGSSIVLIGLHRGGGGMAAFGGCNHVTTARLGMAALLAGAVASPGLVAPDGALVWPALALAVTALILDGVDGWMARRSGLTSAFGARFDMEVDAATIMILATLAWQTGQAPIWVLALGLIRYAFVLCGLRWSFLRADLPPSFRRKVVCVVQVVILAALLAPVIVPPVSTALAALGLAALAWSFAIDVYWQWRHAGPDRPAPAPRCGP